MSSALNLTALLYIFLGGGIGSVLRYLLSYFTSKYFSTGSFPLGTLIVNVLGSLAIGYFAAFYMRQDSLTKFFLITGFCGGFTTFSTFSLESYNLWSQGQYAQLILYIVLSLLVGIGAVVVGFAWGKN